MRRSLVVYVQTSWLGDSGNPKRRYTGWGKWDEMFSEGAHFSPLIVEGPSAQTESLIEATKDKTPAQN